MAAFAKTPEEERLVKRAAELAEKMDKAEAWSLESEAKTILTKLGISDFGQTVETLSGGHPLLSHPHLQPLRSCSHPDSLRRIRNGQSRYAEGSLPSSCRLIHFRCRKVLCKHRLQ